MIIRNGSHDYHNGLQALIFDWAGTLVDFGSSAPAFVFIEAFRKHGVTVTNEQARIPMGKHKRLHTQLILEMEPISQQFRDKHGRDFTDADVEQIYQDSIPLQIETLPKFATPTPHAAETIAWARENGLKVGSNTGYIRSMMDALQPGAAEHGVIPDFIVTSDETPQGRPSPFMIYQNMMELNVWPSLACVKIGDTVVDMEEGHAAGCWTVGVALTGNFVGRTKDEFDTLSAEEVDALRANAKEAFDAAGAHYVIDDLSELPKVVEAINARLAKGERP